MGAILNRPEAHLSAWYFDFKVDAEGRPMLWLLERMVNLRSRWLQRPYGDQGLLIQRQLYERVGGYRPLALMEDLDLVERLSQVAPLPFIELCPAHQRRALAAAKRAEAGLAQCPAALAVASGAINGAAVAALPALKDPISWRTRRHSDGPGARDPSPGPDRS